VPDRPPRGPRRTPPRLRTGCEDAACARGVPPRADRRSSCFRCHEPSATWCPPFPCARIDLTDRACPAAQRRVAASVTVRGRTVRRYERLEHIRRMDPYRQATEIYRLSSAYEFPWDYTRALELALYRTYAVPRIG